MVDNNPWKKSGEVQKKLAERMTEAERHADFYQCLYRQYAHDLTVLAIYARNLLANKDIGDYIGKRFPDESRLFREIVQQTEDPENRQSEGA